jgi:hypothetical protein
MMEEDVRIGFAWVNWKSWEGLGDPGASTAEAK